MRNLGYALLAVVIFAACNKGMHMMRNTHIGGWTEANIPFLNSVPHVENAGGYYDLMIYAKWMGSESLVPYRTGWAPLSWVRNPDNLLLLHNTVKKIGYKNFLSDSQFFAPMHFDPGATYKQWEGISLAEIVDSCLLTCKGTVGSKYYKEFWTRRDKEGTLLVTFKILREIKSLYADGNAMPAATPVNDTLGNLLRLDLALQSYKSGPPAGFVRTYFDYLKSIGLNHSAYNLASEIYPGSIPKDTVIKTLNLYRVPDSTYWQTRNNAIWIYSYADNGP